MKTKAMFLLPVVLLLAFSACSRAQEQSITAQNTASDFTLETIDGKTIVLSDILKEKKAVLLFWATWCPYCRSEIPRVEQFYRENKDEVEVIGIDIGESKAKLKGFLKGKEISYPMVLDYDNKVARLYNVRGVPTIVAVDKDSKILYYGHSIEEMAESVGF